MPPPTLKPISLLLIASTLFYKPHAAEHRGRSSLVLGLTHARAISPSPQPPTESSQPLAALDVMEPLRGFGDGYLISLNLGTPPQVIQVYVDTGSDLTWVPCGGNFSFDCMECDDYRNYKLAAAFSPSLSASSLRDACTSPFCTDIHSSDNPYDPCAAAGCSVSTLVRGTCPRPCPPFSYTYGAGGLVVGSLARDTLSVHGNGTGVAREVPGFCFGCVGSTFREPIGIVGFGRGALSLPSQLGFLRKGFSHCFLGFKFANSPNITSPLVIGDLALSSKEHFQFTPMLRSPVYRNYYYIGLEGISVGNGTGTRVEGPLSLRSFDIEGNGGMLIDSGTTYTHLPEPFYSLLLSELRSKISYPRSSEFEERTGFDLCYRIPFSINASNSDDLPLMTFHFLNDVKLTLPKEDCFYAMSAPREAMVVKCLLFQSMEDGDYGPAGVFGSFQQQNVEVVYDLQKERIGFLPTDCASTSAAHGLHNN